MAIDKTWTTRLFTSSKGRAMQALNTFRLLLLLCCLLKATTLASLTDLLWELFRLLSIVFFIWTLRMFFLTVFDFAFNSQMSLTERAINRAIQHATDCWFRHTAIIASSGEQRAPSQEKHFEHLRVRISQDQINLSINERCCWFSVFCFPSLKLQTDPEIIGAKSRFVT